MKLVSLCISIKYDVEWCVTVKCVHSKHQMFVYTISIACRTNAMNIRTLIITQQ